MHYRILQRNNRIFEILGLYCYIFAALAIDITFTQHKLLLSKSEIELIYFPIKFKNKWGRKFVKI